MKELDLELIYKTMSAYHDTNIEVLDDGDLRKLQTELQKLKWLIGCNKPKARPWETGRN